MKIRGFRVLGVLIILVGTTLILNSFSGITGFVISENIGKSTGSLLGIILVIGGVFLLMSRRGKESNLADLVEDAHPTGAHVMISRKAIERSNTDNRIRGQVGKYVNYIKMIAAAPSQYQQETIGDFKVSPQRHNPLRVAWHYDKATNTVFIDDLLYHINDKDYVDKWNRKAGNGKITVDDYQKTGYETVT